MLVRKESRNMKVMFDTCLQNFYDENLKEKDKFKVGVLDFGSVK